MIFSFSSRFFQRARMCSALAPIFLFFWETSGFWSFEPRELPYMQASYHQLCFPPPLLAIRFPISPHTISIRFKHKHRLDLWNKEIVEAALRRQFISVRRHSRDSRYAAFLRTHCAYTLFSHMCYNRYPPHVDSNILYSTLVSPRADLRNINS